MKPYGKTGLRCMLCDKKFSTENLMAVHFSRRHKEEAMGAMRRHRPQLARLTGINRVGGKHGRGDATTHG